MLKHLQILPIIAGFISGYIVFFVIKPMQHDIVMKYPDPMNPGNNTYRDKNGLCYVFKREEVKCSGDKEVASYPLN